MFELEIKEWWEKEGVKKLNAVLIELFDQDIGPVILTNLIPIKEEWQTEECANLLRKLICNDGLTIFPNMGAKNEVWLKITKKESEK